VTVCPAHIVMSRVDVPDIPLTAPRRLNDLRRTVAPEVVHTRAGSRERP
jgi:hypothetical protein